MNGALDQSPSQSRLRTRIERYATNPPDTEYSLYGPIDTLLHLYFPFDQFWMIKPQAPVRDLVVGHGGDPDSQSRSVNPNGKKTGRADFILTRFSGTGRGDVVNLVIEVKPGAARPRTAAWNAGVKDLNKYFQRLCPGLQEARGGGGRLRGVLIMGTMCFSFRAIQNIVGTSPVWVADWAPEELGENGASLTSLEFANWLIQRRNFNLLPAPTA